MNNKILRPVAAGFALLIALAAPFAQAGVLLGFEGTSQLQNCALGNCFRPPDTMGAVGTTQFLETTNGSITVYDKSNGAVQQRVDYNAFWQNAGTPGVQGVYANGDQRVLFDHYTSRWIVIGFGGTSDKINIAVSDTANALGPWRSTQFTGFAAPAGFSSPIADYPTLGMDDKGVYIGTNNFATNINTSATSLRGTSLFSIPKADLFGGAPSTANMTTFNSPLAGTDRGFAIQGAVNWQGNPGNTANIMTVSRDQFDLFTYKLNGVNLPGATQTAVNELNVPAYTINGAGRQPDGTRLVDTLDDRISANVVQVNGKLYSVHTVTPPGGQYTELRWTVVNAATGALIAQGRIGSPGFDYYQGSIAVNEFGEVVIGYNRSGGLGTGLAGRIGFYASMYTDPGTGILFDLGTEMLLRGSDVDDYRCGAHNLIDLACRQRWGDYSAVTIDPNDHHVFWAIGEYAGDWAVIPNFTTTERAIWHTYIAAIGFNQQGIPEPATLVLLVFGLAGLGLSRRRQAYSQHPSTDAASQTM